MSVAEVSRAMGLTVQDALTGVLASLPSPTFAVRLLGAAVHVAVADRVVRGLAERGLLSQHVTYASAFSGIDTFAAAVARARPGAWRYAHASERDRPTRAVLQRAYSPGAVFVDAMDPAAASAEPVDLYVVTPPCGDFSRRNAQRSADGIAQAAVRLDGALGFVRAGRARVLLWTFLSNNRVSGTPSQASSQHQAAGSIETRAEIPFKRSRTDP